jgi:predicted metal-dependent peptidase
MAIFDDVVTGLLMRHPFYGSLLMRLKHVRDDKLNPPTAAVTPNEIRWHPEFFASMSEPEALFVISHEIRHIVFGHLDHMRHFRAVNLGPDGKEFDQNKYNQACDYVNNDGLKVDGIGKMPEIGLWDARYPHTMTPAEVYCLLDTPGNASSKGKPSMDGHEPGEDPALGGEAPAITPSAIMQAANAHKALGRGDLPSGVDRLVGELRRPKVNPWARLRRLVTSRLSGYDRSTWNRLQRRMIVRGIGMPSSTGVRAGRVDVVVDTSGSIGQEMLSLFGGHMGAIMSDAKPDLMRVLWCDTHVHRIDTVKDGSALRTLLGKKVPGGGGTDMTRAVRTSLESKPDVIVVLTDGYTPFCGAPKGVQLIWAITESHKVSPYGETLHIGER